MVRIREVSEGRRGEEGRSRKGGKEVVASVGCLFLFHDKSLNWSFSRIFSTSSWAVISVTATRLVVVGEDPVTKNLI